MEILFVSHKYPPSTGGMQKQSYELITGMKAHCKVHSLVYEGQESILKFFLLLERRICTLCRQYPNIIAIHYNDGLMAAFCLLHHKYNHLRKVVTLHGLDVVFPNHVFQRYILPKFNNYDLLIAVSEATATAALERGIAKEKITVIPNGVHTVPTPLVSDTQVQQLYQDFDIHPECSYLIALGRPVKRKGFSWFIRHVIPHLNPSIKLLIIGPFRQEKRALDHFLNLLPTTLKEQLMLFLGYPSDEGDIRELLQNEHVARRVRHLGKLPQEQLQILLTNSLAFIMPNIPVEGDMEGFGLVCLEANQCATVVLASAIDGIPDAIQHQKNGILLPPQEPTIWSQQIHALYHDQISRKSLIEKFQNFTTDTYGWDKMVQNYFKAFKQLFYH